MNEVQQTEIKTPVRSLVEFLLREGDIDERAALPSVTAMLEGSRIHRMLQQRMGERYRAEVPLSYSYDTGRYTLTVSGRADGLFTGEDEDADGQLSFDMRMLSSDEPLVEETDWEKVPVIDEIKGTYRDLSRMATAVPVHLAQAKCYAAMYCIAENEPYMRVRMTYCNIKTEDIRFFRYRFTAEELIAWFDDLIGRYLVWTDYFFDWNLIRTEAIRKTEFPFPYRPGQHDLAVAVYGTVLKKRRLFLQAPTGSGKTIATVFPAVKAIGEGKAKRLFYLTAKTVQRTVAEEAFRTLRDRQGLKFKTITLTAKDKICFRDKLSCNPKDCPYALGHFDRVNDALYDLITNSDAYDRETIESFAEKHRVCPFEFALDLSLFADGIICDYNYLFDPFVYLRRFFEGEEEDANLFLIDEAHNLVDRGREMYSAALGLPAVQNAREACGSTRELRRIKGALGEVMVSLLEIRDESGSFGFVKSFRALAETLKELTGAFAAYRDDNPGKVLKDELTEVYFDALRFITIEDITTRKSRLYGEEDEDGFSVKIRNMDPSSHLDERMKKGVASILFSATLLPIDYHRRLLGGREEDYEVYAQSVFDPDKCRVFIDGEVSSTYRMRGEAMYAKIARSIRAVTGARRGNYLVFFPSHAFLNEVRRHYEEAADPSKEELIVQDVSMGEAEREAFLDRFTAGLPDGFSLDEVIRADIEEESEERSLVGFCVLGGVFSEGIDLRTDSLIGAIIVGCGLPLVCRENEMLKDYFAEVGENGFDYAYRFPGMNKVLQAAGRVIRTEEDVGVVALLDHRFGRGDYRRLFPHTWGAVPEMPTDKVNDFLTGFWEKWEKMDKI